MLYQKLKTIKQISVVEKTETEFLTTWEATIEPLSFGYIYV